MKCREARRWMSPYLDSELEGGKTFEVSEHLRECAECEKRFAQERAADEQMRRAMNCCGGLPGEIWGAVQREILRSPRRRHSYRFLGAAGLALAACVAILLIPRASTETGAGKAPAVAPSAAESQHADAEPPWIVARLDAADADPTEGTETDEKRIREELADRFGFALPSTPTLVGGHGGFSIVSLAERSLEGGGTYTELRLTCCGRPVLLAITTPAGLEELAVDGNRPGEETLAGDVRVTQVNYDDVAIVAASRHTLKPILSSLSPA